MKDKQRVGSILLFDGVCNFCNGIVNFLIRQDKKGRISFGSLQSDAGQELLREFLLPVHDFESLVYIKNGRIYQRSTAALEIARDLGGLWSVAYILVVIPKPLRDGLYSWIAKNRYRWFGKKDHCMIPTPDIRKRFID
ncbi:thiol-disulfide oxidoreductase DCC family protein [Fictibacillus sp. KIGAM418]|uniref:Thiol-disulfide oxidoreductase DCC family protein n=1 Tax=Fictibacillus marinisediminis TaxID=2878389 RepID=A0A9X2BIX4_9BACL|nr:thiol-disulfide oxidoreductase DCC family protein [Fictibacillus marinisediminis]MCK6259153.1 thiol-disulfide oxidoreductase DCC family protein [Fictibacillus marinisediminis]